MLEANFKKHIKKLHQKKYRKEFHEFLVEGVKGVDELIGSDLDIIAIIIEGNRRDQDDIAQIIQKAEQEDIDLYYAGRKDIDEIKDADTFPGIMAVVGRPDDPLDAFSDGPIIALDRVKDPGNMGTIIRTADWFGIENILLSEESVDPYSPKTVRSTMGSIARVVIHESDEIVQSLERLKKAGYSVVTLALDGEPIDTADFDEKTVYVFGSESHGVSDAVRNISNKSVLIPGKGSAESLNVAISAAIVMSMINK